MNLGERNCPWWGWWEDKDRGDRKVTERLKALKGQYKREAVICTSLLHISPAFFRLPPPYTHYPLIKPPCVLFHPYIQQKLVIIQPVSLKPGFSVFLMCL